MQFLKALVQWCSGAAVQLSGFSSRGRPRWFQGNSALSLINGRNGVASEIRTVLLRTGC